MELSNRMGIEKLRCLLLLKAIHAVRSTGSCQSEK